MKLKRFLAGLLALLLVVSGITIPKETQAATPSELTFSSGACQNDNKRFLIYFNVPEGFTLTDRYWNNNTVYVNGVEKSGSGINYQPSGSQLMLILTYDVLKSGASSYNDLKDQDYIVEFRQGTSIGGTEVTFAKTIKIKIFGGDVSYVEDTTVDLTFASAGEQDNNRRFIIYFNYSDGFPLVDQYYNNNEIYVNGTKVTSINYLPLGNQLGMILPYSALKTGATSATELNDKDYVVEIREGTSLGGTKWTVANTVKLTIRGTSVSIYQEPQLPDNAVELSFSSGEPQDALTRYIVYLNVPSGFDTADKYWNNNTIYINGREASGSGINYKPSGGKLVLYLQYGVVKSGATKYSDFNDQDYIVEIKQGTALGGDTYVVAQSVLFKIRGSSISLYDGPAPTPPADPEYYTVVAENDGRNGGNNMSSIYLNTTNTSDPLESSLNYDKVYTFEQGGVFYNGNLLSNATLKKLTNYLYYVAIDGCGVTWQAGDVLTIDGVLKQENIYVTFEPISFIRNKNGSFSQYDANIVESAKQVTLDDVYVNVEEDVYTIPSTPLRNGNSVSVKVNGNATTEYVLDTHGTYQVERVVENAIHSRTIGNLQDITYNQTIHMYVPGDTNDNGQRSLADIMYMKKNLLNTDAVGGSADLNADTVVDETDFQLLADVLLESKTIADIEPVKQSTVFGVISDTHYASDASDAQRRINTRKALNYYKSQNVELIIFNADINDLGTEAAYDKLVADITEIFPDEATRPTMIFTADNHEYFDAWSVNGRVPTKTFEQCQELFTSKLATLRDNSADTNTYKEIDGYHFLGVSSDDMDGAYATYDAETISWLTETLDAAVAANKAEGNEAEPIFLALHQPPKDTVYGSEADYGKGMEEILKNYPQLVVFTSHTHCPLNDERSIYQEDYTVINTASLYYAGWQSDSSSEENSFAQGLLVRASGNVVDVERYNFWNDEKIKTNWVVETSLDKSTFVYTAEREQNRSKPIFGAEATVAASWIDENTASVSFSAASHDDFVHHYVIRVYEGSGTTPVKTVERGSLYYQGESNMPDPVVAKVTGLSDAKAYRFEIVAVESWGETSEPISGNLDANNN